MYNIHTFEMEEQYPTFDCYCCRFPVIDLCCDSCYALKMAQVEAIDRIQINRRLYFINSYLDNDRKYKYNLMALPIMLGWFIAMIVVLSGDSISSAAIHWIIGLSVLAGFFALCLVYVLVIECRLRKRKFELERQSVVIV